MHAVAPAAENEPAGQLAQAEAPEKAEKEPALQAVQLNEPVPFAKVPGGQAEQPYALPLLE